MASIARLEELKKKFDENPRRYFAPLANEHRKSGDPDQAIAICRAHLPQQPAHISGHIVLAQALFEVENLAESRQAFEAALALDPENLIALRYMGDIARQSGDVATARSWYQRVLEVDPRNDEISHLIRDLDANPTLSGAAPGAADGSASEDESGAPSGESAPTPEAIAHTPASPPSPTPSADDDPRFAPVALEAIDFDADLEASDEERSSSHVAGESIDPHPETAWVDADGGTPVAEGAGLDPFDMPHSASADALSFEMDAGGSGFGTIDSLAAEDFGEFEGASDPAAEIWTAPVELSSDVGLEPPIDATEASGGEVRDESAAAESADPEFEEGAFYADPALAAQAILPTLEIPAAEPPHETPPSTVSDDAFVVPTADESTTVGHDAPLRDAVAGDPEVAADDDARAEQPTAIHEAHDPWADPDHPTPPWNPPVRPEGSAAFDAPASRSRPDDVGAPERAAIDEPPTIDVSAPAAVSYADAPPSEPQESVAEGREPEAFVVESMEFVPPASTAAPTHLAEVVGDADPLLGRTPELAPADEGATPAAFVTETMAELYLQQGFRNEALAVYRELLAKNPDDAALRERVERIESGSMSSISIATLSEDVVESARRRQTTSPARTVRSLFASLAGRRPPYSSARYTAGPDDLAHEASTFDDDARAEAPDETSERIAESASVAAEADVSGFEWGAAARTGDMSDAESSDDAPPARGLDSLFAQAPVAAREESAAQTLATAFGAEPQGRPTRAASSELSLDHVFRGPPPSPAPSGEGGGFSFDQFFSDAQPTATESDESDAASSRSGDADAHDIEQFTAWLEGLKKK